MVVLAMVEGGSGTLFWTLSHSASAAAMPTSLPEMKSAAFQPVG